jgi:hypothetical protein
LSSPRDDAPLTLPRPADVTALAAYQDSKQNLAELGADAVKAALDNGKFATMPASEFQISLVRLTKHLDIVGEDAVSKVLRLSCWADMEHDAAEQVRKVATSLFPHLF